MSKEYNASVFIGRFQPFHNEHLNVLNAALDLAERVLIIIGSSNVASTVKNPFSYGERVQMISRCLKPEDSSRVLFIPARDYYYNDNLWVAEVQQKTATYLRPNDQVALMGAYKDGSSYYLNLFPQWDFVPVPQKSFLNATDIRRALFERTEKLMDFNPYHPDRARMSLVNNDWRKSIPYPVETWLENNYFQTSSYHDHVNEFQHYLEYRKQWGNGPFVTVDSIVTCSGHVLLVKRKFLPGKGLWALPGGFLKLYERIEDGALRELKEETGIAVTKIMLKNQIEREKVFDYPNRSLRGRTITHAFHINLNQKDLPDLRASDDAEDAKWMPLFDVFQNEELFFEDHFQILSYFVMRG